MNSIRWMAVGLCLLLGSVARADEWSKTFTLTGKPELRVETSDANIRVDTWDKNTIEARVTTERWKIGEGGIKVYERQTGDNVELEVRFPHRNFIFDFGQRKVEVEIHVPREGKLALRTSDGYITLNGFKGEMQLETGDGHQDIDHVDGVLRARASDGHIEVNGRFDGLDVSTGDGHIKAEAAAGSSVTKSWNLRTGDGSVTLRIPQSLAADIDLHTNDGHITLDLPVSVEGKVGEKNIRGKINGGGNLVMIHTGDGSIRLEKS
jgi:hypothetical protein